MKFWFLEINALVTLVASESFLNNTIKCAEFENLDLLENITSSCTSDKNGKKFECRKGIDIFARGEPGSD